MTWKSEKMRKLIDELILEARATTLNRAERMIFERIMDGASDEDLGREFQLTVYGVLCHKDSIKEKILGKETDDGMDTMQ